jgi:type VI secretion system ImpM family protein
MKHQKQWKWFAWGKHPGMQDFVCAGTKTPLFQRFTKWVDNGFARLETGAGLRKRHCSWRFWTKGAADQVVCGVVRNSCDNFGRSFPSLFIGSGELDDWMSNCSVLPFAFEPIWKSFEYIAAARFDTIRQLNDNLQLLQPPLPQWRNYQQRIYKTSNLFKTAKSEEKVDGLKRMIQVDCKQPEHLPHQLQFCNRVTATGEDQAPLAVFIGEIEDRITVAMMNNTLLPEDFVWLWALEENSHLFEAQKASKG